VINGPLNNLDEGSAEPEFTSSGAGGQLGSPVRCGARFYLARTRYASTFLRPRLTP
jgi:hypothetical protein